MSKKAAAILIIIAAAALCALLLVTMNKNSAVPHAQHITIYNQREEQWRAVAYGGAEGKSLAGQGCGVFTLAHAAQWLGLEENDVRQALPYAYSELLTPEHAGYYTNTGMDVCTAYFEDMYEHRGLQTQWSWGEERSLDDILSSGGVCVLHLLTPDTGHWVLAAALSPDRRKVLVIDSCVEIVRDCAIRAYTYDYARRSFDPIESWESVTANQTGNGGAAYWIDYKEADKRRAANNLLIISK